MFELGLTGAAGSSDRRAALSRRLGLPSRLSPTALLDVLNVLYTREDFFDLMREDPPRTQSL